MESNNFLRLAFVLGGGTAQNFKTNLGKIVKLVLFDNYGKSLKISEINSEIQKNYLLEFTDTEVFNSIKTDKGVVRYKEQDPINHRFDLTTTEFQKMEKRQRVAIDEYIKLFVETHMEEVESGLDETKELIYRYLYFIFNADTQTVLELMNYNITDKKEYCVSDEFTPEESKVINSFLNWENTSKNECVLNLISSCFDYCMLTVKKDTSSFVSVFNGKQFFLDSNVIFRLAGFNKIERQNAIYAFISKCTESGIRICYTNHTDEEIKNTIKYYVNQLKKTINGYYPLSVEAMRKMSSKYANLDFYEKYVEWCKIQGNKAGDFDAFRISLEKEIKYVTAKFEKVISESFDTPKRHEQFEDLVDEFTAYKYKHYRNTYEGAIKIDINNYYFMLEKNSKGQAADFMELKYYFITADHCLVEWTLKKRPGTVPIFVLPSVWYSILLKYKGRTEEDYNAFCQFLNIRIAPEEDALLEDKQNMLAYIMRLNETAEIKEEIIFDIESRLTNPDITIENPIAFVEESHQTILQRKIDEEKEEWREEKRKEIKREKALEENRHQNKIIEIQEEHQKNIKMERKSGVDEGREEIIRKIARGKVKCNNVILNILLLGTIIAGILGVAFLVYFLIIQNTDQTIAFLSWCAGKEMAFVIISGMTTGTLACIRAFFKKNGWLICDEDEMFEKLCKELIKD